MRISELQTVPDNGKKWIANGSFRDAAVVMREYGLEEIGNGMRARVFAHPTKPIVLKVFVADDAEYAGWVDLCHQYAASNPYYPRVGNIVRVNAQYNAVRIERLAPLSTMEEKQFVKQVANYIRNYRNATRPPYDENLYDLMDQIKDFGVDDITDENIMKRGDQYVFTDPV